MQRLILTLDTPAANLALDEALLDAAEEQGPRTEFLRLWESPRPVVVVGRSSRVEVEVDREACAARGIPILRRTSGGATIVAGPGCLMYAVVLCTEPRQELRGIHAAHAHVLDRIAVTLAKHVPSVVRAGTSDLAFRAGGTSGVDSPLRKFSGNSLRIKRTHLLYHGTLLYDFDLSIVAACLRTPPRQPEYRASRSHADFIANVPLSRATLQESLLAAWPTTDKLTNWPVVRVDALVSERYGCDEWNLRFGPRSANPR